MGLILKIRPQVTLREIVSSDNRHTGIGLSIRMPQLETLSAADE